VKYRVIAVPVYGGEGFQGGGAHAVETVAGHRWLSGRSGVVVL
jgi:hypothetical protein